MPNERYSTLSSTTVLGSGYTAGSGVLNVASTVGSPPFPDSGNFRVVVQTHTTNEVRAVLKVTGINSATQFAVVADGVGIDNSAVFGDSVFAVLTAEGLALILTGFSIQLTQTPLTARGDLLTVNSTPALSGLAKGTQYQTLQGGVLDPLWDALHLDQVTAVTGILPVGNGGTGASTLAGAGLVIGAGNLLTAGAVPYVGASGALNQDQTAGGQLFWDAANHRLGIGNAAPTQRVDVTGNIALSGSLLVASSGQVQFATVNAGTTFSTLTPADTLADTFTGGVTGFFNAADGRYNQVLVMGWNAGANNAPRNPTKAATMLGFEDHYYVDPTHVFKEGYFQNYAPNSSDAVRPFYYQFNEINGESNVYMDVTNLTARSPVTNGGLFGWDDAIGFWAGSGRLFTSKGSSANALVKIRQGSAQASPILDLTNNSGISIGGPNAGNTMYVLQARDTSGVAIKSSSGILEFRAGDDSGYVIAKASNVRLTQIAFANQLLYADSNGSPHTSGIYTGNSGWLSIGSSVTNAFPLNVDLSNSGNTVARFRNTSTDGISGATLSDSGNAQVGLIGYGNSALATANLQGKMFLVSNAKDIVMSHDQGTTIDLTLSGSSGAVTLRSSLSFGLASSGPILKQGANGRVGTFVANGATPVTVSNTSIAVSDAIIISLNTVGGTVGAQPVVATITAGSGFTVVATAGATSTYNYAIIKNA